MQRQTKHYAKRYQFAVRRWIYRCKNAIKECRAISYGFFMLTMVSHISPLAMCRHSGVAANYQGVLSDVLEKNMFQPDWGGRNRSLYYRAGSCPVFRPGCCGGSKPE